MYCPGSKGGGGQAAGTGSAGHLRVLLIEDDAVLGEAVRDYVAGLGHAVDWMQTLTDARAASGTVDYDLVLLDALDARIGSIDKDTVLVLHQIGSHGPAYYERYPEE